jgi:hypothetical protein
MNTAPEFFFEMELAEEIKMEEDLLLEFAFMSTQKYMSTDDASGFRWLSKGEVVSLVEESDNLVLVRKADGTSGWVPTNIIVPRPVEDMMSEKSASPKEQTPDAPRSVEKSIEEILAELNLLPEGIASPKEEEKNIPEADLTCVDCKPCYCFGKYGQCLHEDCTSCHLEHSDEFVIMRIKENRKISRRNRRNQS